MLPAQRPASPEIAESPSEATHGAPAPGPSADAPAGATQATAMATTASIRTRRPSARTCSIPDLLELGPFAGKPLMSPRGRVEV